MNMLFDLDGTLTDPREGILACIRHALSALEIESPPDTELERFIGPPLKASFLKILGGDAGRAETAVRLYRERFTEHGLYENRVYDDIPESLAALQASGATLYVATSKPQVFAERILEHFGLARHFQAIYGSALDGSLSDKADLIRHVLVTARLPAASALMVGDREHDILGARANAVAAVGVLWGYGSREELQSAGATHLLKSPAELPDLPRKSRI